MAPDLPFWAYEGKPFVITPAQVAKDPGSFREQYERTLAADLTYPLHILDRPERLTILDGVHRLLHAQLLGHKLVAVKKVPLGLLDEIAVR